jgi:uncharacterized phage infection (PIP) family protein YhgE
MRRFIFILSLFFLFSCTSNTIFEKPKDLIPKDTMSLLIQEMFIATSSKFFINNNKQKSINYMPFVYDRFKIDSTRFKTSNLYYMSKIDDYKEIVENAKDGLEKLKNYYAKIKERKDSIRKDSINKIKELQLRKVSKDSIKKNSKIELDKLDTISKSKL